MIFRRCHCVYVSTHGGRVVQRRDFLRWASAGAATASVLPWKAPIAAAAETLRQSGRACILLWMQGGPSQFETFSPKPSHDSGGETSAVSTSVAGIEVSENLPRCAAVMHEMALIRSMTSKEGNHQRATYLLHHGYLPMPGVKHPTLGAHAAHRLGSQGLAEASMDLPGYVRIGRRVPNAGGGGFLGVEFDPLHLESARRPPQNTQLLTSRSRFERRRALLTELERDFAAQGGAQVVEDQRTIAANAAQMILSPQMDAFDLERESERVRTAYGSGEFAAGCLMARRLIERGVTFVEVSAGNWDTHQDNFNRSRQLAGQIDQPMAQLIVDLKERGLLPRTLVLWMGEFGRTPHINPRGGRDHFPRAYTVALAGGGVRGGQVVGSTDASGSEVRDRPVTVNDLFCSVYSALGIDPNLENASPIGRPIKLVDGGKAVSELFA